MMTPIETIQLEKATAFTHYKAYGLASIIFKREIIGLLEEIEKGPSLEILAMHHQLLVLATAYREVARGITEDKIKDLNANPEKLSVYL